MSSTIHDATLNYHAPWYSAEYQDIIKQDTTNLYKNTQLGVGCAYVASGSKSPDLRNTIILYIS